MIEIVLIVLLFRRKDDPHIIYKSTQGWVTVFSHYTKPNEQDLGLNDVTSPGGYQDGTGITRRPIEGEGMPIPQPFCSQAGLTMLPSLGPPTPQLGVSTKI